MSKQNRLVPLKKLAGCLGVAGISALVCLPAGAQIQPNPGIKNSSADDERVRIAQSPQTERQAPADVPTTKPGTSSPDISPGSTSKPGMSPSAAISQAELQKFANAVKKIQPIQQSAQRGPMNLGKVGQPCFGLSVGVTSLSVDGCPTLPRFC